MSHSEQQKLLIIEKLCDVADGRNLKVAPKKSFFHGSNCKKSWARDQLLKIEPI